MLGFASSAQVMMTYLPLYLHNAFGLGADGGWVRDVALCAAAVLLSPVAAALAMRVSGRVLLTVGLAIVALGNIATPRHGRGPHKSYAVVAIGMVMTGCGAGFLNGETAKVSMSVIPPERGGMASGISGTLRFIGLVTGITGLGAVLASGTQTHFIRTIATSGLAPANRGRFRTVSRVGRAGVPGCADDSDPGDLPGVCAVDGSGPERQQRLVADAPVPALTARAYAALLVLWTATAWLGAYAAPYLHQNAIQA